jgi:hypothetical protein
MNQAAVKHTKENNDGLLERNTSSSKPSITLTGGNSI